MNKDLQLLGVWQLVELSAGLATSLEGSQRRYGQRDMGRGREHHFLLVLTNLEERRTNE